MNSTKTMYRNVAIVLAEVFRALAIFSPFYQIFWLYFECVSNVSLSCPTGHWCLLTHPDFIILVLIFFLFLVPFSYCLVVYIAKDDWAPWRWYVNLYRPLHDALISFLMTPDLAVLVLSFLFMILTWLLGIGIFQY